MNEELGRITIPETRTGDLDTIVRTNIEDLLYRNRQLFQDIQEVHQNHPQDTTLAFLPFNSSIIAVWTDEDSTEKIASFRPTLGCCIGAYTKVMKGQGYFSYFIAHTSRDYKRLKEKADDYTRLVVEYTEKEISNMSGNIDNYHFESLWHTFSYSASMSPIDYLALVGRGHITGEDVITSTWKSPPQVERREA